MFTLGLWPPASTLIVIFFGVWVRFLLFKTWCCRRKWFIHSYQGCSVCVLRVISCRIYTNRPLAGGWDKGWFTVYALRVMPCHHRKNDWHRALEIEFGAGMHTSRFKRVDYNACSAIAWICLNLEDTNLVYLRGGKGLFSFPCHIDNIFPCVCVWRPFSFNKKRCNCICPHVLRKLLPSLHSVNNRLSPAEAVWGPVVPNLKPVLHVGTAGYQHFAYLEPRTKGLITVVNETNSIWAASSLSQPKRKEKKQSCFVANISLQIKKQHLQRGCSQPLLLWCYSEIYTVIKWMSL